MMLPHGTMLYVNARQLLATHFTQPLVWPLELDVLPAQPLRCGPNEYNPCKLATAYVFPSPLPERAAGSDSNAGDACYSRG
jgi:hypothetical protein